MDWSALTSLFATGDQAPLSDDFFVCLGAGSHQLPLLRAAQRQGLRVAAVDREPTAPGFALADACLLMSTGRPAAIRRMIGTQIITGQVRGVATRSFGTAAVSAAALAASLGLPGAGVAAVRQFRNKRRLKQLLGRAGVRVPAAYAWRTVEDRFQLMRAPLPLVVRPAVGHGKLGVQMLRKGSDLRIFLRNAGDDNGSVLLEEFVQGAEITVLGMVHQGNYVPVSISQKTTVPLPLFAEERHSFPVQIPDKTRTAIQAEMQRIVRATQLSSGPIVAEFLVGADSLPVLVEASPEVGGEFIADCVAELGAGVPFFDNLIQIALGGAPVGATRPPQNVVIRYLMPRAGILKHVVVPDGITEHPGLLFAKQLKATGSLLSTERGNLDRPFAFALSADSSEPLDRLEREVERLADLIEVQYEDPGRLHNENHRRRLGHALPTTPLKAIIP